MGKPGTSRTLYVVIQNPHESLEDRLERQRDLLEKFIGDLAERLERGAIDDPAAALATIVHAHESEESHLALLGQLIDEDRRNGTLGKALRNALAGVADRLEKLLREEGKALAASKGRPPAGGLKSLDKLSVRHVAELENDVVALDATTNTASSIALQSNTGDVRYRGQGSFTLAQVAASTDYAGAAGMRSNTGNIRIQSTTAGATVAQTSASPIEGNGLELVGNNSAFQLANASNQIVTIAGNAGAAGISQIIFRDTSGDLDVGAVGATSGLSAGVGIVKNAA